MCYSSFCTTFIWNIFHSKKNRVGYDRKCVLVFMWSTHYSCPALIKLEFSRQVFEKSSNIRFQENPSSESRVVLCERTERRTGMTKLTVAFPNFASAPKNLSCNFITLRSGSNWNILLVFTANHLAPNLFFYSSGCSVPLHITRNGWRYSISFRKLHICDLVTRPRERFSPEHALHIHKYGATNVSSQGHSLYSRPRPCLLILFAF